MVKRLTGRKVLITGASRGIGFAIAEAFAEQGADLVLSATTEAGLKEAKSALGKHQSKVTTIAADLSPRRKKSAVYLLRRRSSILILMSLLIMLAYIWANLLLNTVWMNLIEL